MNKWQIKTLGELIDYQKGFAFNSALFKSDSGIRVIRISDTNRNSITDEDPVYISYADFNQNLKKYLLKPNDILVSTVGSRPPLYDSMVGKVILVPQDCTGSLLNQNLVKLITKNEINNYYLYTVLNTKKFLYYISSIVRGNANQVSITLEELFKFPIFLPPIAEQKKIAEILGTCDRQIELTEKLITTKRQLKRGLMQQIFTSKLRFKEFENKTWKTHQIGKICQCFSGGTPSRNNPKYFKGNIPWIKSGELNQNFIYSTEESITDEALKFSSAKIVEANTVLVAMYGATAGVVGFSMIRAAINQAILAIIPSNKITNQFLYYYIHYAMLQITKKVQGGQPNLNASIIKSTQIELPAIEEQIKISVFLEKTDKEIL